MGCDNALCLKHIGTNEFDCPPVPPKPEISSTKQISAMEIETQYSCKTLPSSDVVLLEPTTYQQKYFTEGRREPAVPSMDLIEIKELKPSSAVWQKQS